MRHRRGGGFTLIEVLLALAIAAVIMSALFSTMYTTFRAKTSTENALAPLGQLGITMDMITRDLASARPPQTAPDPPSYGIAYEFVGTSGGNDTAPSDDVTFFAPTSSPLDPPSGPDLVNTQNGGGATGLGGTFSLTGMGSGSGAGAAQTGALLTDVRQVEYHIVDGTDGTSWLVRDVTSNLLADTTPDQRAEEEVLIRNIQGFRVEYYDGTSWQTSWDSTTEDPVNQLPLAVRVTLDLPAPGAKAGDPPLEYVRVVSLACYVDLTLVNNTAAAGGQ